MLEVFPDPFPGEMVYSTFVRYHILSGNPRRATTMFDIYQDRVRRNPTSTCPPKIAQLSKRMPPGHPFRDPERIALQHTALPYHARYFSEAPRAQLLKKYSEPRAGSVVAALGFSRNPASRDLLPLAFCLGCIEEDRKRGSSYWRVVHQLPYVTICPDHGCRLQVGCQSCGPVVNDHFNIALPTTSCCDDRVAVVKESTGLEDLDAWISTRSAEVWREGQSLQNPGPMDLRDDARNAGFRRKQGIDYDALAAALKDWLGSKLFSHFGWQETTTAELQATNWLRPMMSPLARRPNTLRLLVLQKFLADQRGLMRSAPEQCASDQRTPFDRLPELYRELKTTTAVAAELGLSWHAVKREATARGLNLKKWARPIAERQQAEAIESLLQLGTSIESVCDQLKIGSNIVWSFLRKNSELKSRVLEAIFERKREQRRQEILAVLNSATRRTEVHAAAEAAVAWLTRYDRVWLEEHLPRAVDHSRRSPHRPVWGKDWALIDREWSGNIRDKAMELYAAVPPVYVCFTVIATALKIYGRYYAHRDDLPLSQKALEDVIESKDAYYSRRLSWTVQRISSFRARTTWKEISEVSGLMYTVIVREREAILEQAATLGLAISDLTIDRIKPARSAKPRR